MLRKESQKGCPGVAEILRGYDRHSPEIAEADDVKSTLPVKWLAAAEEKMQQLFHGCRGGRQRSVEECGLRRDASPTTCYLQRVYRARRRVG